ncbi:MAG: hypothetical protein F6K24_55565 [Okeania sp. SIO2D1]|nr:hypothetical protein [Okeania sp. SIO2C9]NES73764.1 hypothetical protein [Okeania sp. SIO2D1]
MSTKQVILDQKNYKGKSLMSTQIDVTKKSVQVAKDQKSKTRSNDYIKSIKNEHYTLLDNVIIAIDTLIAISLLSWHPISNVEIGLLIGMWALSMVGMIIGVHNYFAHRRFKTSETMISMLATYRLYGASISNLIRQGVSRYNLRFNGRGIAEL